VLGAAAPRVAERPAPLPPDEPATTPLVLPLWPLEPVLAAEPVTAAVPAAGAPAVGTAAPSAALPVPAAAVGPAGNAALGSVTETGRVLL
jgi:hypothetical protein